MRRVPNARIYFSEVLHHSLFPHMDHLDLIKKNLNLYDTIKPKRSVNSFTVLATVNDAKTGQLLALATGTQASLRVYPDDIEDCHAESLVKRAFKRHILDRLLQAILQEPNDRLGDTLKQLNEYELILFVSQFPCGLLRRYQGVEPIDEGTGATIERKPGRGQEKDGKVVYVQRNSCLNKLKRWISTTGFQGKRFKETLKLNFRFSRILIGDCEPDLDANYPELMDRLSEKLNFNAFNIVCASVPMRRDDFVFDAHSKQPQPVAVVWWRGESDGETTDGGKCEHLVDGRKMGLTKKQCQTDQNESFKLKIGDYWLRKDLARVIHGSNPQHSPSHSNTADNL